MPWSQQGGGGAGGPWGSGQGGAQPPDLEEFLRRGQERFRRVIPGGIGSGKGIVLVVLAAIALWLLSGFYRVEPDEQGVVLRFGEWVRTTSPGLNYHLPSPIESVLTPKVTVVNRIEIGLRSVGTRGRGTQSRDVPEESLMLTGDENIVDINFRVLWVIKDAGKFLFNIRNPESTVKTVAESAMREVIGQTRIQSALTEGRQKIETATRTKLQSLLDQYGAGIEIRLVQLLKVDPPQPVVDAFIDVQRAQADQERLRNEAEGYRNDILPRARGESERMIQEARAYKEEIVNRAQGDAQRFLAQYEAYKVSKDVTVQRLYLETMEDVLSGMTKIIIDPGAKGGQGVVPYLPLPELRRRSAKTPPAQGGTAQ